MKGLLIGSALGALAMFFWGFLWWGAPHNLPYTTVIKSAPDEAALAAALTQTLPATGVYVLPNPASGASAEEVQKRAAAGPIAQVVFVKEGAAMGAGVFIWGYVHMFVTCLIGALILRGALASTNGYGSRVSFVLMVGLAGSFFSNLGKPIWWHQPWPYHLAYFAYDLSSWLLAALILAKFVRSAR
jgi:hypothetical protein